MSLSVTLTFRRPGSPALLTRVVDVLNTTDESKAASLAAETLNKWEESEGRQQPLVVGFWCKPMAD